MCDRPDTTAPRANEHPDQLGKYPSPRCSARARWASSTRASIRTSGAPSPLKTIRKELMRTKIRPPRCSRASRTRRRPQDGSRIPGIVGVYE